MNMIFYEQDSFERHCRFYEERSGKDVHRRKYQLVLVTPPLPIPCLGRRERACTEDQCCREAQLQSPIASFNNVIICGLCKSRQENHRL